MGSLRKPHSMRQAELQAVHLELDKVREIATTTLLNRGFTAHDWKRYRGSYYLELADDLIPEVELVVVRSKSGYTADYIYRDSAQCIVDRLHQIGRAFQPRSVYHEFWWSDLNVGETRSPVILI